MQLILPAHPSLSTPPHRTQRRSARRSPPPLPHPTWVFCSNSAVALWHSSLAYLNRFVRVEVVTMKVLVTGATGFLGGYVVSEFARSGYDVVATGRNNTRLQQLVDAATAAQAAAEPTDPTYPGTVTAIVGDPPPCPRCGARGRIFITPMWGALRRWWISVGAMRCAV